MTGTRAIRVWFILACVAPAGCASVPRHVANAPNVKNEAPQAADNDHAELERELSLYSD